MSSDCSFQLKHSWLLPALIVLFVMLQISSPVAQQSESEDPTTDGPTIEGPKVEPPQADSVEELPDNTEVEPFVEETVELPEVQRDLDLLPFPTRRMHELILEATRSGDIEKLRAFIGTGDNMTLLSLGGIEGDPIDFLKEQSGDDEGHEILAILEEILESGYVHLDAGTEHELYVWPYFFAYPINKLEDRQMVELFRIVTFGDFEDMMDFGGYIFYRVGITPTGRWQFFVAGD